MMLRHKDYQGEAVLEDGCILIKILHIQDFITTQCNGADEVEAAFVALVEEYLETCAIVGKEPEKPYKGSFNVRVSPALHRAAALAATKCDESLNAWVQRAIEHCLEKTGLQDHEMQGAYANYIKALTIRHGWDVNASGMARPKPTMVSSRNLPLFRTIVDGPPPNKSTGRELLFIAPNWERQH